MLYVNICYIYIIYIYNNPDHLTSSNLDSKSQVNEALRSREVRIFLKATSCLPLLLKRSTSLLRLPHVLSTARKSWVFFSVKMKKSGRKRPWHSYSAATADVLLGLKTDGFCWIQAAEAESLAALQVKRGWHVKFLCFPHTHMEIFLFGLLMVDRCW